MKRLTTLMCGMFMIAAAAQAQTLVSFGFEEGEETDKWYNTGKTYSREDILDDAANAHNGKAYLKAVVSADSENPWDNQCVFQGIPVEANTFYRWSLWHKADAAGGYINVTVGNYSYSDVASKYEALTTPTWERTVVMINCNQAVYDKSADGLQDYLIEAGMTHALRCPIHFPKQGTYYVDDVCFMVSNIAFAELDGKKLTLNFGFPLEANEAIDASAFSVKIDGVAAEIESVAQIVPEVDACTSVAITLKSGAPSLSSVVSVSLNGATTNLLYSADGPATDPDEGTVCTLTDEPVDVLSAASGVANTTLKSSKIYLAGNQIVANGAASIEVYAISGAKVAAAAASTLDIESLPAGVYMVKAGKSIAKIVK